jgi:hypothetical protein
MFLNVKDVPTADSEEYVPFFENELEKIRYGLTIDGVYIHGWLYWHLNHWNIYLDEPDPRNPNDEIRVWRKPHFRDNEWLIAQYIKLAEEEKKGLLLFGTRRFAKSDFEASWVGRGATIYQGSESVISSTNEADIKVLASKLDKGLASLHPYFRFGRLQDDWRKEVSLGVKERKTGGRRIEWSKIWIRNLDEGKNTEAIAGTTPKILVIDEVGKAPFLEAYEAAKPGFTTSRGWRCVPILTGTGGLFEPNSDAEKVFKNPDAHNFVAVEIPGKAKKYGVFLSGKYRMEAKKEVKFSDFIQRESGILIPEDSELNSLTFYESDEELAKKITDDEVKKLEKANDPRAALKGRMYYPFDPDDCFLSDEVNDFPIEAIRNHLLYLDELEKKQGFVGIPVELYRNVDNTIGWKTDIKRREILDFPVKPETMKDAPIMIYEPPVENPPHFLYIAGCDPYNQNVSATSPSLGTLYIYKRMYDPVKGTFQNMIVASFASRPQLMKEWNRQAEMLIELYNATCMIENMGTNFIDYLDGKNKAHLLADGYNLLVEIAPNTGINVRPKGLPAVPRVINHCMRLFYDYCLEEIIGFDERGVEIKKLGVTRIRDRMLLTEMLNYSEDQNVDRIVAFRHVLAYDSHLLKTAPIVKVKESEGFEPPKKQSVRSPFTRPHGSPFSGNRRVF